MLQLVGDAGAGKSRLLQDLVVGAHDMLVLRGEGVPSEMDLPFACLQSLIHPVRDLLPRLPSDQSRALSVALGMTGGDSGGDLVLRTAFLRLLGIAAETAPVLLLVDDLQWVDDASYRCLSFASRRLGPEAVAVVLATRPGRELDGVARVALSAGDAVALRASDRAHEFVAERASGYPADSPLMLLVALLGPGESAALAAAAGLLGVPPGSLEAAEQHGVVEVVGSIVRFRNALVRQAVLQLASPERVRAAHRVLAVVLGETGPAGIWHAAAASDGPDPILADRLDRLGVQAVRSGVPTAAPAFARAAALSIDPADRAARLLRAAEAALAAGATDLALAHLDEIDAQQLPIEGRAQAAWIRGRAELLLGHPQRAAPLLVVGSACRPPVERAAALSEAVGACVAAGDIGFARLLVVRAEALETEADLDAEDAPALLLHVRRARAAVLAETGDIAGATAMVRPSLEAFAEHPPGEDSALWLALGEAHSECGELIEARAHFLAAAGVARLRSDIPLLSDALCGQAFTEDVLGRWTAAYATGTTALEWTEGNRAPLRRVEIQTVLAEIDAARGHESRCRELCDEIRWTAGRLDLPHYLVLADRRESLLDLGLNHLPAALDRLERARSALRTAGLHHPFLSCVPDLVEILVRMGRPAEAAPLLVEFAAIVPPGSPPSAEARLLRTRALLADEETYPRLFEESVALDERTGLHFLRARTLLCWGERLRRDQRRLAARTRLRAARGTFETLEAAPWSARTAAELSASGSAASPTTPPVPVSDRLTPQELQIAVLVAEGRRNREIAGMLFLSVRTVEFHLTSVFRKIGVGSRSQLAARIVTGSVVPGS